MMTWLPWLAGTLLATQRSPLPAALAAALPLLTDRGRLLDHERFAVIALDRDGAVIDAAVLFRGASGFVVLSPDAITRWVRDHPRRGEIGGIAFAHNHPSGDPTPGADDRAVARQLDALLEVPIVEHLIVGDRSYARIAVSH